MKKNKDWFYCDLCPRLIGKSKIDFKANCGIIRKGKKICLGCQRNIALVVVKRGTC